MIFVTLVGEGLSLAAGGPQTWPRELPGILSAGRSGRKSSKSADAPSRRRSNGSRRSRRAASFLSLSSAPSARISATRLIDVEYRKDGNDHRRKLAELSDDVELALIEAERNLVNNLYRAGELKDEGRRRIERELDLRDTLVTNLRSSE